MNNKKFSKVPTYPIPVLKPGDKCAFSYGFFKPVEAIFRKYEVFVGFDLERPEEPVLVGTFDIEGDGTHYIDMYDYVPTIDITKDGEKVKYEMSDKIFGLDKLKILNRPIGKYCYRQYLDDNGDTMYFTKLEYK